MRFYKSYFPHIFLYFPNIFFASELSLNDESSADDKGLVRMKHVVSTMLDKLKTRIDTTEKVRYEILFILIF